MNADVIFSLSSMFNFSVSVTAGPESGWGTTPTTGSWADPNSTFEGLFGAIVAGDYDIALSDWYRYTS